MQKIYRLAVAMVAAAAISALNMPGLHAQAKPPIYVLNDVEVTDRAGFATYAKRQDELVKKHDGRFIIRARNVIAIEGPTPKGFAVYVFDSIETFQAWRNDPQVKELLATRDKVGKFVSFAAEGCSDCPPAGN